MSLINYTEPFPDRKSDFFNATFLPAAWCSFNFVGRGESTSNQVL